jgi:NADPH2:quinone reductase
MKAIGLFKYGGPEVLEKVEIPEPHAGPGQVRIRVRAAGINPADVMLRDGLLKDFYRGMEPPFVPGMDAAGTIDEMGEGVDPAYGLAVGEGVVGIVDNQGSYGGYSEYVVLPADSVTRKPAGTTFPEAASFLMNALTARCALDAFGLTPGATLLVTGAAGAFGGYVTQLAASEGLRVVAVASERDEELLRSFGADVVLARGENLAQRILAVVPEGVDAVADGALLHNRIVPAIRDHGHIAVVQFWDDDPGRGITVHPINVRTRATDHAAITRIREQVESGILTTRVAATFPVDEAVAAHRRLDQGGLRGRIILEFEARDGR